MTILNTLIIENSPDSKDIIKRGINLYNASNTDYKVSVIDEVDTYENAVAVINSLVQPLHLIFLDIELNTAKTGMDICKEYPNMAYIVVSVDSTVSKRVTNETEAHPYYYVEKVSEGVFRATYIVSAIEKFIKVKGSELNQTFFEFSKMKINKREIAFISKKPLSIDTSGDQLEIKFCTKCERANASFFYCLNEIDASKTTHKCLLNEEKRTSLVAMNNIIQKQDFDPDKFIQIGESVIINLDYIYYRKDEFLYMSIKGLSDGSAAIIKYSTEYIPNKDKALNNLINTAIKANREK